MGHEQTMNEVKIILQKSKEVQQTVYDVYKKEGVPPDLARILSVLAETQNMIMMAFTSLSVK